MFFQPLQQIIQKAIIITLLSCSGFAGTCDPITADEELQEADMVFAGKVITNKEMFPEMFLSKELPFLHFSPWREHAAIIQVSQIWKGSFKEQIQINYFPNRLCGPSELTVGEEYLLFIYQKEKDLRVMGCSLTKPIRYAEKDLTLLGKGMMVSSKPPDVRSPNLFTACLTIGILGLIFAVWLFRKKYRTINKN